MVRYVKPAQKEVPFDGLHMNGSLKRVRNDIEALLRTYDEVTVTWPKGSDQIDAKLADGRTLIVLLNIVK